MKSASSQTKLSPVTLMKTSSVVIFLTMFGHAAAYPWTSTTQAPQEAQVVELMKHTSYVFFSHTPYAHFGQRTTYWGLYFGWGLMLPILLLTIAIILWVLSDLARLAPRKVSIICGVLSMASLGGAYVSSRFFFTPPVLTYSVSCILLMTAAVQLWRWQNHNSL